jgi:uncharacterized protein with NAD-binding domain and iron-sulfur cluster
MGHREKVVVVGGGVAGLTAAHELVERDFDVVVYERAFHCGGKAASVRVPGSRWPGEHGFRFFPGWYKHLPHTMGRIPYLAGRERDRDKTVLDRLVDVSSNLLAKYDRDPVPIVLHAPRNAEQVQQLLAFFGHVQRMGLSLDESLLFVTRLAEFLGMPEEARKRKYDAASWWQFVDADNQSAAFRTLTIATTRTLIAAKATEASAYTIATMAVRTLFETPLTLDRVLDGPTSEVWFEPWQKYLEANGVEFRFGYDLDAITFHGARPAIRSLRFSPVDGRLLRYVRDTKCKLSELSDGSQLAECRRMLDQLADWRRARDLRGDIPTPFLEKAVDARAELDELVSRLRERIPEPIEDNAAYYVFAIPLEQMAYYVNRSTMMTHHDPSLRNIITLSNSVDWMAGIQFYFRMPLDLGVGHIVFGDSEWALTAIEQTQFWRNIDIPDEVESILSVDISAWDRRGRFNQKEAFQCTRDEIAEEVWEQLKASFKRSARRDVLRDDMLIAGNVKNSYYLDDSIVERYDRKKQAAYNSARAGLGSDELLSQGVAHRDALFTFGGRLEMNIQPIFINRPGSLALRPPAATNIENMFLAGDYIDTATNLACMEGANEAARLAVNALLDTAGSACDRCQTWNFGDHDVLAALGALVRIVKQRPGLCDSITGAWSAATAVRAMVARAKDNVVELWNKR